MSITFNLCSFHRIIVAPFYAFAFKSPMAGAQSSIMLAVDLDLENVTGKFYADCEEKTPSRASRDEELAKWLWNISAEMTKL